MSFIVTLMLAKRLSLVKSIKFQHRDEFKEWLFLLFKKKFGVTPLILISIVHLYL